MLNVKKYTKQLAISISGGLKMVHEWSNEQGEGEHLFCADLKYLDDTFYISTDDLHLLNQQILAHINSSNYGNFQETDLTIIDNRICWNQIEDADCTIDENGKYLCDYDIYIAINGIDLNENEIREILTEAA